MLRVTDAPPGPAWWGVGRRVLGPDRVPRRRLQPSRRPLDRLLSDEGASARDDLPLALAAAAREIALNCFEVTLDFERGEARVVEVVDGDGEPFTQSPECRGPMRCGRTSTSRP